VQPLARFGATDEQLAAEAARKKASLHYARTELRSVQPELQRTRDFVPVDISATRIGKEVEKANDRARQEAEQELNYERAAARVRARVKTVVVPAEEPLPPRQTVPARGGISEQELEEL